MKDELKKKEKKKKKKEERKETGEICKRSTHENKRTETERFNKIYFTTQNDSFFRNTPTSVQAAGIRF